MVWKKIRIVTNYNVSETLQNIQLSKNGSVWIVQTSKFKQPTADSRFKL